LPLQELFGWLRSAAVGVPAGGGKKTGVWSECAKCETITRGLQPHNIRESKPKRTGFPDYTKKAARLGQVPARLVVVGKRVADADGGRLLFWIANQVRVGIEFTLRLSLKSF
jgi:hypothetical protein